MQNKITRRDWLVGSSAVAGGMMLTGVAGAQDISSMMNAGMPISKENPIRFTNNENPYGINPKAKKAMIDAHDKAHMYQFSTRRNMEKIVADMENVPVECIASGAGSTEFLMAAGAICGFPGGNLVAPDPTYRSVTRYVERFGGTVTRVPVNEDMAVDLDDLRSAVTAETTAIYICNPNNPIPTIVEKTSLTEFCLEMSKKAMVIIDEAYFEYATDDAYGSMVSLAKDNPNILVLRTASKIHAFASIRVGFAFGHPDTIKSIRRFSSMTASYPAMMGAIVSYQDLEYQKFIIDKNNESMEILYNMFEDLGRRYIKSNSNFTYFHAGHDAKVVYDKLLESGCMVGRPYQPFADWVRISTAKPEEMKYLVEVYKRDFG